ncbi:uncharacterized protein LOC126798556 isoform X2 [Argentina anserina]|uniref:uncharacterized protein LOC126798556 isoform X2 n=1 Tax=Argentina anserina TaxID=57926 RepID=UPI00217689F4|nr:uncharacterized protein LOC126798556 isoform X2 [Potentilla anserina]
MSLRRPSASLGKAVAQPPKTGSTYKPIGLENFIAQAVASTDNPKIIVSSSDPGKTKTDQITAKIIQDETLETIDPPVVSKFTELKLSPRKEDSDENLMDQTVNSDGELFFKEEEMYDDDDDDDDEGPPVCHICLKENEHWTPDCPFLDSIPDPRHTKVGFDYMIVCKCHYTRDAHDDDDDDWEAVAVNDPYAMMAIQPADSESLLPDSMTDLQMHDMPPQEPAQIRPRHLLDQADSSTGLPTKNNSNSIPSDSLKAAEVMDVVKEDTDKVVYDDSYLLSIAKELDFDGENVCDVCERKNEHLTHKCPFLQSIPDPRNTKVGFTYMIVCKCCDEPEYHSDDGDWEGKAVLDQDAFIFLCKDGDDTKITDVSKVETLKSRRIKDPEFGRRYFFRSSKAAV